jgi:5,10-methylene-tetrahydrofolate dehydrogenase/methenyl tetrahydrofolate cyclohydrolase
MQTNVPATEKSNSCEKSTPATEANSCTPELVTVEVANLQSELVFVHNKPQDGSAMEAASELCKLTEVLSEKASDMRELATQAFLGQAEQTSSAMIAANPEALEQMHLHSDVQEAVDSLHENIAQVQMEMGQDSPAQAADHAQALDEVADVLDASSEQIKNLKVSLAAKELNNMDGFDR